MSRKLLNALTLFALLLPFGSAVADEYSDTIKTFRSAGQSGAFFNSAYAYAVFPTVGKGGLIIGGAAGDGRVYRGGKHVGNTEFGQISLGLQAGGQAYSMIVFLQDQRAFKEFTSGSYKFGAEASAVAIKAGAAAGAGTAGNSASASDGEGQKSTAGKYHKGMAVFTLAKGGLMLEVSIAGGSFSYEPL